MTAGERSEIAMVGEQITALAIKVDHIERRLDRWDGAITFVKAAASFVGLGGLAVFLAALAQAANK